MNIVENMFVRFMRLNHAGNYTKESKRVSKFERKLKRLFEKKDRNHDDTW